MLINSDLIIVAGDYSTEPTSNDQLRTIGLGDWCYIADLQQQCYDSKCVVFQERLLKVLKCYNFLSAMTTQLLSSSEFCKLHYDTIPVQSASANVSFYTSNSKMPNFEL